MRRAVPLLELFGIAALVATVLLFRQMHDYDPTLWRGGDLAASFCFVVLDRGSRPSEDRARRGARRAAAALARRAELRDLSLALAGDRAHASRRGHLVDGAGRRRRAGGDRPQRRRALVPLRRAADPHRKPAAATRPAAARGYRLELVGAGAMGLVAAFAILFVVPESLNPVTSYVNPPKANAATHHTQTNTDPRHRRSTTTSRHQHEEAVRPLPPGRILALGDSVMLGCSRQLKVALQHHVRVDATVGPADRGHGQRAQTTSGITTSCRRRS